MTQNKKSYFYIFFMSALLIVTSISMNIDSPVSVIVQQTVWGIFVADFIYGLKKSPDRFIYANKHLFSLLACIPFHAGFRFFKIGELLLVFIKKTRFGQKYILAAYNRMMSDKIGRLVVNTILVLMILPIPLIWIEPDMKTYSDVLWWVIQTTTTVGYGDIVPVTFLGRLLAAGLMILGIGLIASVSSMLTRFLVNDRKDNLTDLLKKIEDMGLHELEHLELQIKHKKKQSHQKMDVSSQLDGEKKDKQEDGSHS